MSRYHTFLDANILYSWNLNHIVMFLSRTGVGLVEPYWSQLVFDEAIRNRVKSRIKSGLDGNKTLVKKRFDCMENIYSTAKVTGFEELDDVEGVDRKDQHVAKAAIHIECKFLLTDNIKDFSKDEMIKFDVKVTTPDSFFCGLLKKHEKEVILAISLAKMHKLKGNEQTFEDYLSWLKDKIKLKRFIPRLILAMDKYEGSSLNERYSKIIENEKLRYSINTNSQEGDTDNIDEVEVD